MSVSAPREALQQVAFETRILQHAIDWLRQKGHGAAADAMEVEFIRLAKREGKDCPCGFTAVVGPCTTWFPDSSGGFCRRCAHHKDCHRTAAK